jgi:hypothetical protein
MARAREVGKRPAASARRSATPLGLHEWWGYEWCATRSGGEIHMMFSCAWRWAKRYAALLALVIVAFSCTCTSDRCTCPGPEPPDVRVSYAFRQAVPMCDGCDPCWLVYWHFQCAGDSCYYRGHYDPRTDEIEPEWLTRVREIELSYERTGYPRADSSWGSARDPALTPRDNEEAEELALSLSLTLVAPQQSYELIAHDLALIRATFSRAIPELNTIKFQPYWVSSVLGVELTPTAYAQFEAGEYHDLDQINTLYGATRVRPFIHEWIIIDLRGRYRMPQLASIYRTVPSVQNAHGDSYVFFCDPSTIFAWRDDGVEE